MILTYAFNTSETEQLGCPFIPKSVGLTPHLLNSLRLLAVDVNRQHYLEDEDYQELIVAIIEVVVTTLPEKQYKDAHNTEMKTAIVDICLNLMVITRDEAELIQENAEEYINLTLDCCDKQ